ncbi:G-protein coupled receptor moody-like isoform X2 [Adelges cooleyi]|nr:G-protein coupled receptor moody-like isoform X2 [Adelges cooleyi]
MHMAAFTTILVMCVGIIGNSLTILALLRNQRIRNVASTFIICLGAADLLFCIAVLPFSASRFLNFNWTQYHTLCLMVPFFQYGNVGVSLLFISMITINRYIMIVHTSLYSRIYRPIWIAFMITFCLVLAFGMQVPTLLGVWGEFKHDPKLGTCSITTDKWGRSSKTALFITGFVIPCIIIVCCYTGIFWVIHKSENRMQKHQMSTRSDTTVKNRQAMKKKRNEWRITKMVLAIFLSFVISYLPITMIKITDPHVYYPGLHLVAYITLYSSACLNPIIYVIMNKQYRKAYKSVLTFDCCTTTNYRMPVLRSISKRLHPHDDYPEEGCKTVVSQVSIALHPLNNSLRISDNESH